MDILEKIKKEWELSVLLFVFLVIFIAGGLLAMKLLEEEDSGSNGPSALPASPHFFDMNSLSYLEPAKLPEVVNPLAFRHSLRLPKPKPPAPKTPPQDTKKPEVKPQPKDDGKKPVTPTAGPVKPNTGPATTTPTMPTPPPPKPKPKRKIKLLYSGYMAIEGGSEKAFVRVVEEKAKKRASGRYEKGTKLLDAVQIVSFDEDKIVFAYSGNKQVTVRKGKNNEKEVTVE